MKPAPPVTTARMRAAQVSGSGCAATVAPMRGLLVTFEGIDRSGKTTQARLLCDALGDDAVGVREPGGTALGERVRELLKDPSAQIGAEAEALLFAAARAELVAHEVRPALERGKVVVSDRFLDSSLAYQGAARGLGVEEVERINRFATGGLVPDLTILLEIDPAAAAARAGESDRFEDEGRALQEQVGAAYEELAEADPGRWRRIDADRSVRGGPRRRAGRRRAGARGGAGMSAGGPELAGTEDHPQARIVLGGALRGEPSHAYLFHGPAGVGKRTVARAFAAELLAEGDSDPDSVRTRVAHGSHPDLTWVRPSGAHVMRTDDVDVPVVAAASRTPFEARRRVFVLERVDTMNDEVANRMLKTLEEPASFVHLILLTDQLRRVLETVVSRCQLVRFDPLPAARVTEVLEAAGVPAERAAACARLALGNADRARYLASPAGEELRADVERIVSGALAGGSRDDAGAEPWRSLLARAEERRAEVDESAARERAERLELEPKGRARKALERELEDAAKRDSRRAATEVLDLGLGLAALGFRDLVCLAEGAEEAVLAPDRSPALADRARGRDPRRLREAAERCEETRQSLLVNVSEELALSALGFRLAGLVGAPG